MAVATLSPEGKLNQRLHDLGISIRQFVAVAQSLDEVQISLNALAEALSGKRRLGASQLNGLLALMKELQRVRQEFSPLTSRPLPMNWSDADGIKLFVFALRCKDASADTENNRRADSKDQCW